MQYKLAFTFIVVVLALFALAFNLIRIFSSDGSDYAVEVLSQYKYSSSTIQARRGDIVDRNGTKIATSEQNYIIVLDPKVILYSENYTDITIQTLVESFGFNEVELRKAIADNSTGSYLRYLGKETLSYDQVKVFEDKVEEINSDKKSKLRVKGVWFEIEYSRSYPFADSGCKVIGFTTSDSADGLWGIENKYDSYLSGENGRVLSYLDENYDLERTVYEAEDGHTVVSTLDMSAQAILEANIDVFMEEVGGENVGVLLMNPNNGEILAMASNKRYDLNDPRNLTAYYSEEEQASMSEQELQDARDKIWRNFCLSDSYEPGSTAKAITIAAGIEEGILHGTEEYLCDGAELRGGWLIRCNKREGHGILSLYGALDFSCNDALMQIGTALGPNLMYKYLELFGYGQFTGIDLPGEASCEGLLYTADKMGESELATTSFGQSYNITMVQQAAAYAAIINGGYYYEPRVVKEIRNQDGAVIEEVDSILVRQAISDDTSSMMRGMLLDVVENGTGSLCKIEGYQIGGKTGASEKLPRGTGDYVVSFISYISPDNPELLLYVVIDTPNIEDQSSSAQAQYLARACWEDLLPYYNIFPNQELDQDGDGQVGVEDHNPYTDDSYENGIIKENPTPEEIQEAQQAAQNMQDALAGQNGENPGGE